MSTRHTDEGDRTGNPPSRKQYDKELVRDRTLELLALCLGGTGKDQGTRLVWGCPACGKQDKYSVKKMERKGGCLVEGCSLAGYDDVFGMLAKLHGLDYHADFLAVLAKAYDLLGLQPSGKNRRPPVKNTTAPAAHRKTRASSRAASGDNSPPSDTRMHPEDHAEVLHLASRVYERILELCPLETRDRDYLKKRGLSCPSIQKGRFGTMTAPRARKVKAALQREFGREQLLKAPGFSEDGEGGCLKFTLAGDYILIPYHDRDGGIATIEGRCVGEPPEGMGKYVSLRRSGNHLYFFPGHRPEEMLAVCEGAMGAIVAAECGLSVGAIQGCQRFRASPSSEMLDGEPGDPLPELKGVDFDGRTIPYIPDADDPPNPNVLRAAPKATRWIAEPQNGRPAICLLPRGSDLDEWLLSLDIEDRGARFTELLAGANPPEDGIELSPTSATEHERENRPERNGKAEGESPEGKAADRRGVSRGARKLRDEVYRAMIEALPLKEEHFEALAKNGVWRATARVGRFASFDEGRAEKMVSDLTDRFGAKKLLPVPGFEPNEKGRVRFSLASSGEFILVPCFDAEGFLSGGEALAFDPGTKKVNLEETVPLAGAGSHLYVFAPYKPGQVEGFCEGVLGALLAAQEDIVVGATGGFRRYKAASGPSEGRQPADAALPELEGVDFGGRAVAYAPRAGAAIGEQNARYHEAARAARWLVERQNGLPAVVGIRGEGAFADGRPGSDDNGPTSLGEWILSLPEDEAQGRLRELFPHNPARDTVPEDEDRREEESQDEEALPPLLPPTVVYSILALSAVVAALLDVLLARLEAFAGYVRIGPGGEQILYAGILGPLRRLFDSAPLDLFYELRNLVALVAGLALMLILIARVRRGYLARWRATRMRLEEHWELHLAPGKTLPSRFPVTLGEMIWAVLAWPMAFVLSGWLISATQRLMSLAEYLQMVPDTGTLVASPTLYSVYAATLFSAFVLWRRRSMRAAEADMLAGKIRH